MISRTKRANLNRFFLISRNHVKNRTNLPAVEENAWQKMNTKRPAITIRSEAIFTTIWQKIQTEIFRPSEVDMPFFKKRSIRKSSLVFSEIRHDAVVPRLYAPFRFGLWLAEERHYSFPFKEVLFIIICNGFLAF